MYGPIKLMHSLSFSLLVITLSRVFCTNRDYRAKCVGYSSFPERVGESRFYVRLFYNFRDYPQQEVSI